MGTIEVSISLENINTDYRDKLNERIAADHIEIDHDPDLEILQTMISGAIDGGNIKDGKVVYIFDWRKLYKAYLDELGLAE